MTKEQIIMKAVNDYVNEFEDYDFGYEYEVEMSVM